jgi:hypothetical protein
VHPSSSFAGEGWMCSSCNKELNEIVYRSYT